MERHENVLERQHQEETLSGAISSWCLQAVDLSWNRDNNLKHFLKWNILKRPLILKAWALSISGSLIKLFSNWIWRLGLEKEARWRNLIQAKYGSQPFDLKAVDTNSASSKSPWKYIMKQKDLIIHNIQCKPGKGASTTFWSGTCCNLQLVYSNLFVLVNSKEVSIVCVWNSENGAWTGISEETLRMRKFPNGPLFLTSSLASF